MADPKIRYSVVVPFFNERDSIMPLYQGLKEVLEASGAPFECVFVDDGSTDGSFALLQDIAAVDSRVVVVKLRHNFGKSAALCAGFDESRGELVVTRDGDGQHDPADLPRFMQKLEEGYDIVCGWRTRRKDGTLVRRMTTRAANTALAWTTGVHIHDFGGGYKAYRRELIAQVPIYGELQRLIPVLAFHRGARVCEVPVTVQPREHGKSNYGWLRKLPVVFDLITIRFLLRYLSRPLHFFGSAGMLAALAGGALGFWLIAWKVLYGVRVMEQHGPLLIF